MKKIIALAILALSLAACPQRKPEAVAEKAPVAETPTPVGKTAPPKSLEKLTQKLAGLKTDTAAPAKDGAKYTIVYPADWELKNKFMGTDTMALSMTENAMDTFRENINVVIEPVRIKDRDAYYEANLKTMKQMMTGFKIISSTQIKLASGIQAINLVYLHQMGEIRAKNRAVFMYEKGHGYVITATAQPLTFTKYNKQFEQIIQSFRLL